MKEISLSRGKVAIVDDEDYEFLSKWKWFAYPAARTFYAARRARRSEVGDGRRGTVFMHRILNCTPDGYVTDHINADGLDNRRCNFRSATVAQNGWNRRPDRGCKSEYKGVSWNTRYQKWHVTIQINKKRLFLGRFPDERDAAAAYNARALREFGEFYRGNEI